MTNMAGAKIALIVGGFVGVAVLSQCGARLGVAMPQTVHGDDVLSVAFGDAKETISRAMVHKADSYFHGGVDMECSEDHDHDCEGEGCSHEHHHHDEDDESHGSGRVEEESSDSLGDPWRWINSRIRAPEVERHLEGERAVELMPWFWAAVKADPHNIDAWTTAIYMASRVMRDEFLTQEVLREARSANPDDLEILLYEGKILYKRGRGDVAAAEKIFISVRDLALSRCGNDIEQLTENDRWMYKFALNYLADIEKKK